jgi:hypothetical protein
MILYDIAAQKTIIYGKTKQDIFWQVTTFSNTGVHKSQASKFCMAAPNIYGHSVCNFLHVTLLAPKILIWLLDF